MKSLLELLSESTGLIPENLLMAPTAELVQPKPAIIPFRKGVIPPPQGTAWPAEPAKQEAPQKPEFDISAADLKSIMPKLSDEKSGQMAHLFNVLCPKYGLDDYGILDDFIGQVAHESGEFAYRVENLNYSWQGLRKTFPKYFPTDELAKQYAFKPEAIANRVYANRMGNGPEASGDGWRNRGGGFIMLTGDEIWQLYSKYIGVTVQSAQTLVRNTDHYALDSAMWYFAIYKSLRDEAARDEFRRITISINGGLIGAEDRMKYTERAKSVLKNK